MCVLNFNTSIHVYFKLYAIGIYIYSYIVYNLKLVLEDFSRYLLIALQSLN